VSDDEGNSHGSLLGRYVELYNLRDLDGCVELFVEDAVQVSPDGTVHGRRRIRERLARQLAACPDMRLSVGSFVEQGDSFADEWAFAGTHTGPFLLPDGTELAPTGRPVEIKGMEFVQVRDGKIVTRHLYYDYLSVATQFGVLPQPVAAS
jgi:predicted ester cyclase